MCAVVQNSNVSKNSRNSYVSEFFETFEFWTTAHITVEFLIITLHLKIQMSQKIHGTHMSRSRSSKVSARLRLGTPMSRSRSLKVSNFETETYEFREFF